ncbi:hypothetical protein N836_27245 [Leptolyngbya sp. Heron Island J]|uniref:Cas10/Cmr2 second palm domain-containing protein n=1 Tax=Leptolyngbya sp. Heron Island J TaxID=1385935 RepID=UPI0003B9D188|nr:hypothetical protein [Leptolyngbya sp. Heron Island J]ESA32288.1 hypothetical protein N836_27245 [Leptolyngbya sp. Heron Island J]
MREVTLTFIDTTGIQPYIFNSNRLRENIGASFLVEEFSTTWVEAELKSLGGKIPDPEVEVKTIESGANVEVIYSAGGNSAILFKEREQAIAFVKRLSFKLLQKAPGINIIVVHKTFDWDQKTPTLKDILDNLRKTEVEAKKNERRPSVPQLGLGVTADCISTRLPAVAMSDSDVGQRDSYRVSREVKCKINANNKANKKLQAVFKQLKNPNQVSFDFPLRLDDVGRTHNESSYVAIVHADGNSMGERFKQCGQGKNNRKFITDIRALSQSIQAANIKALQSVVECLLASIVQGKLWLADGGEIQLQNVKEGSEQIFLPFRPIVFGGDDTTFICDGRLGIILAKVYLETFEQEMLAQGENLTACAGISIAKAHYPFARSYEMSERLCKSAKKLNQNQQDNTPSGSALDWHIASTGLLGTLDEIRDREYTVPLDRSKPGRLYMRPVWVTEDKHPWRNWQQFEQVVQAFSSKANSADSDSSEQWNRNKVIALREELRAGPEATENFLKLYRLGQLPGLDSKSSQLVQGGWDSDEGNPICGYFDAIEAIDFYVQLKTENASPGEDMHE